jgi:hypothetical protein
MPGIPARENPLSDKSRPAGIHYAGMEREIQQDPREIRVECHAGYRADEHPLRFTLRGRLFEVLEVEDRWYSPGALYFRVRAEDGNFYVLRHEEGLDVWTLDAFRAGRDENSGVPAPELIRGQGSRRVS